ncbi:hypothetical protein U8V72_15155 [Priestia filamentosa]|uniref:hypothetical protein n=1 Tax=Priestia filamentosa TaxID=1402861 RepID=UPI000588E9D4
MEFLSRDLIQKIESKAKDLRDLSIILLCTLYKVNIDEYEDKIKRDPLKLQEGFWCQLEEKIISNQRFLEEFWKKQQKTM